MKTDRLQGILVSAPKVPLIIEDVRPQSFSKDPGHIIQDYALKQPLPGAITPRPIKFTTKIKTTNQAATDLALRLGLHP